METGEIYWQLWIRLGVNNRVNLAIRFHDLKKIIKISEISMGQLGISNEFFLLHWSNPCYLKMQGKQLMSTENEKNERQEQGK